MLFKDRSTNIVSAARGVERVVEGVKPGVLLLKSRYKAAIQQALYIIIVYIIATSVAPASYGIRPPTNPVKAVRSPYL